MSSNSSPLIETLNPERFAGLSMDFIGAGLTGLLVKNGQVVRTLKPGRHFSFALPLLEQCQLILVDAKLRQLDLRPDGNLVSRDQFLINVSLAVIYQVVDPKRVALELSDPLAALTAAITDGVAVAIGQFSLPELTNQGRGLVREYMLDHATGYYTLGFSLEDVRIKDITFPESRGVIRQVEGMSARQEAEQEAMRQIQIAKASQPIVQPHNSPPVQQVNLMIEGKTSHFNQPGLTVRELEGKLHQPPVLPPQQQPILAPTVLKGDDTQSSKASLVHRASGTLIAISTNPFTMGREPNNNLVVQDPLCSRYHAKIVQIKDQHGETLYQLVDMGSSNGTFVGEQRIAHHQPFWLSPGLVIKIGDREWTFSIN